MDYTTIGIDVSKAKLDICFLVSGEVITVSNDKEGFAKLLKRIRRYNVDRIVIEHTGNYQKEVVLYLQKHNLKVCVVNPSNVRNFAKAAGIIAKTDKIDAYVLAKYGEMFKPDVIKETDLEEGKLYNLITRIYLFIEEIINFYDVLGIKTLCVRYNEIKAKLLRGIMSIQSLYLQDKINVDL